MSGTTKHVKVRVEAGGDAEVVEEISDNTLRIETRAEAERGQANQRIREIVGEYFGVPVGVVWIVSGHRRPNKIVTIKNCRG